MRNRNNDRFFRDWDCDPLTGCDAYPNIDFIDIEYPLSDNSDINYEEIAKDLEDIVTKFDDYSPTGIGIRLMFPNSKEVLYETNKY